LPGVEPEQAAKSLAIGRIAVGTALIAAPGAIGRAWIGRDGGRPAVGVFAQVIGGRDVAMGLGTLIALRRGRGARLWLQLCAMVDAVDFACTYAAADRIDELPRRATLVVAGGAFAQAAYAAAGVES
jgi:hypothetical protein